MKKIWIVPVAAALAAGGWYYWQQHHQSGLPEGFAQSNGRLELKRFDVASLYAGRVKAMLVDEGSRVEEGDVLAELSSDTSTSQLDGARAQKQRAQEAVARAEAEIKAYEQQQKVAQLDFTNTQNLRRDDLVSDAELSKRRAARDSAAASVNDDMAIRAPIAGRVEYTIAEVGNVIGAGSKVVSLLDPSDVSMAVFLPTTQISRLKVGDEARIVLDGMDAVWPAAITFIATDAQFTPKSVETQSEREKLMFKVKLQVPAATAAKYNGLLKGGLTGNGYVRLDNQAAWPADLALKLPH